MSKIKIETASDRIKKSLQKECIRNSEWLLNYAKKQYKLCNYRLAVFFAITAYEECLKAELIDSLRDKLLSSRDFNEIWGRHDLKQIYRFAPIVIYLDDNNKPYHKMIHPRKASYLFKFIKNIIKKRERSLYVGYDGSKIELPGELKAKDASLEIKRADREISDFKTITRLPSSIRKGLKIERF